MESQQASVNSSFCFLEHSLPYKIIYESLPHTNPHSDMPSQNRITVETVSSDSYPDTTHMTNLDGIIVISDAEFARETEGNHAHLTKLIRLLKSEPSRFANMLCRTAGLIGFHAQIEMTANICSKARFRNSRARSLQVQCLELIKASHLFPWSLHLGRWSLVPSAEDQESFCSHSDTNERIQDR